MTRSSLALCVLACSLLACRNGSSPRDDGDERAPTRSTDPTHDMQAAIETRAATMALETLEREPEGLGQQTGHGHEHAGPTFQGCPVAPDDAGDVEALLDRASDGYRANHFAQAYDCASMAADLEPRSIDAHHLRAASAAALGHLETAQMAYTLALALDPDDPDTLAAAADFFINSVPRSSRESILIGLEHARRGRDIASTRRGVDRGLRARLVLLEAQALNDLGQSRDALARADASMVLHPAWSAAQHERGVALFNLCRFASAREAFAAVVADAPNDAYAHYYLGLINERLGQVGRSEYHFQRARNLAPDDFWAPVAISRTEFRDEVDKAISELSPELMVMLDQVSLELVDVPSMNDLTAVEPPFSPTILGLFRGLPLGVEDPGAYALPDGLPVPPRAIVLYRMNLARIARTRAELDNQIRQTLLHELGHLSGMDEDELRRRGLE